MRFERCGISLILVMTTGLAPLALSSPAPDRVPPNLTVELAFQVYLDDMWRLSPTFRGQCHRLAAAAPLQVHLRAETEPRPSSTFNARTRLVLEKGLLTAGEIYLRSSPNAPEHIAHELEHILEQIDGVDLAAHLGTSVVWKSGDHTFETRRAIEAGRRVAREVAGIHDATDDAPNGAGRSRGLVTALQRDRNGGPASAPSARVSANGRHVAFTSMARLNDADQNDAADVYVLDLESGNVSLESGGRNGASGDGWSQGPDISADGRYVVFESTAGNLTDVDMRSGEAQVFVRDRTTGVTRLLSSNADGAPANAASRNPVISADGTTVVFESSATDLVDSSRTTVSPGGIYIVRPGSGVRSRVDVSNAGEPGRGQSMSPSVSADGRFVAFLSKSDLTCATRAACEGGATAGNSVGHIYVRHTTTNATTLVTRGRGGGKPDGASYHPAISGNGRYVAFVSEASNLTPHRGVSRAQVYLHDLLAGVTELVSQTPAGRAANGASARPAVSYDGSTIAFQSLASDLLQERRGGPRYADYNLLWDVFVHDRSTGRTSRVSADADGEWMENSRGPSLDAAGRVVAFESRHPLDEDDRAHDEDLYIFSAERSGS